MRVAWQVGLLMVVIVVALLPRFTYAAGYNFAYRKPGTCSSASRHSNIRTDSRGAVDGCYDRYSNRLQCCFVSDPVPYQWMMINLNVPINIKQIVIFGYFCPARIFFLNCDESNPLWLLLSNRSINPDAYNESFFTKHHLQLYQDGIVDIQYDPPVTAQYVLIKQFNPSTTVSTIICEVEVFGGCADYFFGEDCLQQCHCAEGACEKKDGICPDGGCQPGWLGKNCNITCKPGSWGQKCKSTCPECYLDNCNNENGKCMKGCAPGLTGENCTELCKPGFYYVNCKKECGYCSNTCDRKTGACIGPCLPGWTGEFCLDPCSSGRYGNLCGEKCGECANKTCHHVTGNCLKGCTLGWKGAMCRDLCEAGTYGVMCELTCGHCMAKACHLETGFCPLKKCETGWTGDLCDKPCTNNTFGLDCSLQCGVCLDKQPCNATTGQCMYGCEPGYHGEQCIIKEKNYRITIYYISGSVGILLIVVLILINRYRKKKRRARREDSGRSVATVTSILSQKSRK